MANTRTPLKGCVRHVRQHTREQSSFVFAVRLNVRLRLGRVLINAQIAAGYALTSRLRYPAIAIIMEHSDVLFDIHNAKNDA